MVGTIFSQAVLFSLLASVSGRALPSTEPAALLERSWTNPTVLPLGDSITYGVGDPNGNGYRLPLLNDLHTYGRSPTYIGTVREGTMANNQNEGHNGYTITQIQGASGTSLSQHPDLVLVHAGTNDFDGNGKEPQSSAPQRLGTLIDYIFSTSPNSTVFVAQIISAKSTSIASAIDTYNSAVPGVVAQRANAGKKVLVTNMSNIGRGGNNLSSDGLHPSPAGYQQMADAWYATYRQAVSKKWLS